MKKKNKFKDFLVVAKVVGAFALIPATLILCVMAYAYNITAFGLFGW